MKQILHIFAKDARHQRLEILLSLAFVATLVLTYRSHWKQGYGSVVSFSAFGLFTNLPQMLVFIIPLGWWLLISPLIHSESLVGDRQFWITRPYEWKKLLAAKVLFLIAFLYVPLLLAQSVILAQAGFSPISHVPGLLFGLLVLTCALVLPLAVLAAVTRNFAQMTLAVLGALASLVAIVLLASNPSQDRVAFPHADWIAGSLYVGLCLAVVVLQYARRKVKVSWIMLGLLVVMLCAFSSMGGAPDDASMNRNFPPLPQMPSPAHFAYRLEQDSGPSAFVTRKTDWVGIAIPIHVTGVAEGSIVIPTFVKVTLQAPDGSRWTSVWQSISMDKFFPGEKVASERFVMPRALYDSFKGKPLNVNLQLALTTARAADTTQIQLPVQDFSVPNFGVCTPLTGFWERPDDIGGLACRAPLRQPELTLIRATWFDNSCMSGSTDANPGIQGAAWVGSLERGPAEFGIVPVWSSGIAFTNQQRMENNRFLGFRKLCPGTPITFTPYKLSGRTQSTFSISGFQLPELSRGQVSLIVSHH